MKNQTSENENFDNLNMKIYEMLKDADYETSSNILTSHLQRIICDKTDNKEECFALADDVDSSLKIRIDRLFQMKEMINGSNHSTT